MKAETLIYEKVRPIIPEGSSKTIFFVSVTQTSYEVFFYSFIDDKPMQCFELAEQEKLDENKLDLVFAAIVDILKKSKVYKADKNNIATITVDKSDVKMDIIYAEKGERMYAIKKEWKQNNIQV